MGQALSLLFGEEAPPVQVDGLAEDPGGELPGVDIVGNRCSCTYPPVFKSTLHQGDKDFWNNLDEYSAQTLLAKKPDGEAEFAEGMRRFEIARDQMSAALHTMQDKYTDLAIARRNLEQTQQGAAWEHFSKCRPLSKKYGLYLPCHENFKAAMQRYRGLLQKPGCPVGASLPLRPASMGPDGLEPLVMLTAPHSSQSPVPKASKGADFL
ncbi:unnamed protein product [Symbiodinium necroappetens]|uniref:Uncharacterized protein n=1 Tax=Symbiodinium necroappetens TaxID=1628268 RepID=A0A812X7W0_9DINO|nr:unnamed protein product [Symbiodinium necroappetens]